jgi:hypothetical protein
MPDNDPNESEDLKELRATAKNSRANAEKAALLEKENAFLRAGIDTESKPAKALIQSYDGDLAPDAIRKEAADWGLVKPAGEPAPEGGEQGGASSDTGDTPNADDEAARQAAAQQQDMRNKLQGSGAAPPPETPAKGGIDQAKDDFLEARKSGMPMDKSLGLAVNNAIAAGIAGDKQAAFDADDWEARKAAEGHGAQYAR